MRVAAVLTLLILAMLAASSSNATVRVPKSCCR